MNARNKPTITVSENLPSWASLELLHAILVEQPAQRPIYGDGVQSRDYQFVGTNAAKLRGAYRKALDEALTADDNDYHRTGSMGNRCVLLSQEDSDKLIERLLSGEIVLPADPIAEQVERELRFTIEQQRDAA